MTFDPSGLQRKGYYNFWQGFPIEPKEGDCELLLDFLWTDICGENDESFQCLLTFCAHLIQHPGEKPGVALILKGPKGVGKDTAILLLRALVGTHFAYATCTEDILGKFNVLMAQSLLVHLEEATWGGDPRAAKKFQGLITSETLRVEPKGIDAYTTPNFARFILSTNDEWAVPALGDDERRYALVETPGHWADNGSQDEGWRNNKIKYFRRIYDALKDPNILSAWMYHLSNWQRADGIDLSTAVRLAPRNTALAEQKASGFMGLDAYWYDALCLGIVADFEQWDGNVITISTVELSKSVRFSLRGRKGERNPPSARSIGKRLKKIAPSVSHDRRTSGVRTYDYTLPPITVAREEFARAHSIAFNDLFDAHAQHERAVFELI